MTPERVETSSTTVEESLGLLNPKGTAWRNITMFSKRQPLGAFGAVVAIVLILVAIFAPLIATHDPLETNVSEFKFAGPGTELWLGGDQLGRDVFSRLVYGARISLLVGILSVVFGVTGGFIIGVVSGYFGGKTDLYLQRIMDAMIAFPALILALAIMAVLGPSIQNVIIALTVVFIPGAARTIRAETLRIKEMDYVLAARSVGAADWRIMMRHIAPNCFAMYIVLATISLGWAIIVEASLSFLGAGISRPTPAWGLMVADGREFVTDAWWVSFFPGLAILLTVLSMNLLGDWLRDKLDPKQRNL
jgi:ABC-type dipeptide/oligopeptide/nickel transport system permease subunit